MAAITQSHEVQDQKIIAFARKFLTLLQNWEGEKRRTDPDQLVHKRTGHLPKTHREWDGGVYNLVEAKVDLAKLLEDENPDPEEVRKVFLELRNKIPM